MGRENRVWDLTLWFPYIFMLFMALKLYSHFRNVIQRGPPNVFSFLHEVYLHLFNWLCFAAMLFMRIGATMFQGISFWPLFYYLIIYSIPGRTLMDIAVNPRNVNGNQPKPRSRRIFRRFTRKNKSYLQQFHAFLMILSSYQLQDAYAHVYEDASIDGLREVSFVVT